MHNMKMTTKSARPLAGMIAFAALLTACAASPQVDGRTPPINSTGGETNIPTPDVLKPFTPSGNASMDVWRNDFARRAVASGRDVDVVQATLEGIKPLKLYLGDEATVAKTGVADQAEFAKPIWECSPRG